MALLDFRKKAKEKSEETMEVGDEELPEELEKFRVRAKFPKDDEPFLPEEYKRNIDETPVKKESMQSGSSDHKLDLILSKLDTIDARLKLLEEKLKRV